MLLEQIKYNPHIHNKTTFNITNEHDLELIPPKIAKHASDMTHTHAKR